MVNASFRDLTTEFRNGLLNDPQLLLITPVYKISNLATPQLSLLALGLLSFVAGRIFLRHNDYF